VIAPTLSPWEGEREEITHRLWVQRFMGRFHVFLTGMNGPKDSQSTIANGQAEEEEEKEDEEERRFMESLHLFLTRIGTLNLGRRNGPLTPALSPSEGRGRIVASRSAKHGS